ncbi:MAG: DUF3891 family protein [Xanthobacteraceae bacterium]
MIVRYQSDGSVVMITQNDHAKLAGFFAAHWGNSSFERPRPHGPTVRAAHYHDSGWFRYETDPRFDGGKTPTYRAVPNDNVQLESYQWAIDMLTGVDRYTGLLVSKHRTGLWQLRYGVMTQPPPGPPRSLSDEIKTFIARNETQQNAISAEFDAREVATNYQLLQTWDLLSLYVCSSEQLKDHVIAPVPTAYSGDNAVTMRLTPRSDREIAIDPFPFDRAALAANVVYRQLQLSELHDKRTFQAAYFAAQPQIATCTFVGQPPAP